MLWCVLSSLGSLLSEHTLRVPRCSRQEKERGKARSCSKCAAVLALEGEAPVETRTLLSTSAANAAHVGTASSRMSLCRAGV